MYVYTLSVFFKLSKILLPERVYDQLFQCAQIKAHSTKAHKGFIEIMRKSTSPKQSWIIRADH